MRPEIAADSISAPRKTTTAPPDYSAERTLEEIAKIAFFDPLELFDVEGNLRPLAEIPAEVRRAIQCLEVMKVGTAGTLTKVKLADRGSALDKLMRYHSLYRDRLEVSGELALSEQIKRARERIGK